MADFRERLTRAGQDGRPPVEPGLGADLVRRGRRRRTATRGAGALAGVALLGGVGLAVATIDDTPTPVVTNPADALPEVADLSEVDGSRGASGSTSDGGATPGEPTGSAGSSAASADVPTQDRGRPSSAGTTGGPAHDPVDDGTNDGATDVGVTGTSVTIFTLYEEGGAIPGILVDPRYAMESFEAYAQEELGPIHGRTIEVEFRDARMDPGAARQAAREACAEGFGMVGTILLPTESDAVESFTEMAECPDLRGVLLEDGLGQPDARWTWRVRQDFPQEPGLGPWAGWSSRDADAVSRAAWIAPDTAQPGDQGGLLGDLLPTGGSYRAASEDWIAAVQDLTTTHLGYDWLVDYRHPQGDTSWYAPRARELQDLDVQFLRIDSSPVDTLRFVQKLREINHWPTFTTLSPDLYLDALAVEGGADLEGAEIALDHLPWFERATNPVLDRYLTWMDRVHPTVEPTRWGLLSWAAAERFVEDLRAMGPAPERWWLAERWDAAQDWDASGALAPDALRGSRGVDCHVVIAAENGAWVRAVGEPGTFTCP